MKLLLDSHTLIWSADDAVKIPSIAMATMQNPANELFVSVASVWEIAIKCGKGNLPLSLPFRQWIDKAIADLGLDLLSITLNHAERLLGLPYHHRDPFDRLIAAQSMAESISLVSADPIFDAYGVTRIWT